MTVTSLIDNVSTTDGIAAEHGLSLHIRLDDGRCILFDMGQGILFADNASRLGCAINEVGMAVISHGHYDHGGGLGTFLELNTDAPVFVQRDAFQPHYSMHDDGLHFIGLDPQLQTEGRLVMCDGITRMADGVTLFSDVRGTCCYPTGNGRLHGPGRTTPDTFGHEQNLIIEEGGKTVLFAGCAHRGIVNIIRKSTDIMRHAPTHVFAGMHLMKSGLGKDDEEAFIRSLASQLMSNPHCRYYTMHCTGTEAYSRLRDLMGDNIRYVACGDRVEL